MCKEAQICGVRTKVPDSTYRLSPDVPISKTNITFATNANMILKRVEQYRKATYANLYIRSRQVYIDSTIDNMVTIGLYTYFSFEVSPLIESPPVPSFLLFLSRVFFSKYLCLSTFLRAILLINMVPEICPL